MEEYIGKSGQKEGSYKKKTTQKVERQKYMRKEMWLEGREGRK